MTKKKIREKSEVYSSPEKGCRKLGENEGETKKKGDRSGRGSLKKRTMLWGLQPGRAGTEQKLTGTLTSKSERTRHSRVYQENVAREKAGAVEYLRTGEISTGPLKFSNHPPSWEGPGGKRGTRTNAYGQKDRKRDQRTAAIFRAEKHDSGRKQRGAERAAGKRQRGAVLGPIQMGFREGVWGPKIQGKISPAGEVFWGPNGSSLGVVGRREWSKTPGNHWENEWEGS